MKQALHLVVAALAMALTGSELAAEAVSGDDKEFIRNASELGLTEVELGKLAQQRGSTPEIKQHGSKIFAEYSRANDELAALAKAKGVDLNAEPAGSQKHMINVMGQKSGAEFDKEYVDHQTKGHREAIDMFRDASQRAADPDVKAFATKQLPQLENQLSTIPGGGNPGSTEDWAGKNAQ